MYKGEIWFLKIVALLFYPIFVLSRDLIVRFCIRIKWMGRQRVLGRRKFNRPLREGHALGGSGRDTTGLQV